MSYRNVTAIEDLPDLDMVEPPHRQPMEQRQALTPDQYSKFIRTNREMYQGSGMEGYGKGENYTTSQGHPNSYQRQEATEGYQEPPQPAPRTQYPAHLTQHSCLDIAGHIQDCPICSRFYNTDKTIYIIIIVILSLICLLLIKKILNL